jgi:hypothetical protein
MSAALVVLEIAVSVVLVTGAGLLLRTLGELLRIAPGFRSEHLLTAVVTPDDALCVQHEIGIRMALGTRAAQVRGLIVGQALGLAGLGAALGLGVSLAATRLLRSLVYGVSTSDPLVLGSAPLLLASIALLATWAPARRTTRLDPTVALRGD